VSGGRWVPTLEDYLDMAAVVLGSDVERLRRLPRLDLAESAIHAPFASFGGEPAYPELVDQAAVLIAHLAQNHPLPDGNKRAAFLLAARFLHAKADDGPRTRDLRLGKRGSGARVPVFAAVWNGRNVD
jgi:death-on-curing protein